MTLLTWDDVDARFFEAGVDRGVLYVDGGVGVPWNGLISISENNGNTVENSYFDGVKFNDLVTLGEFSGSVKAFTYPEEFFECEGFQEDERGMFFSGQPPKRFHLCYRTKVGSYTNGTEEGYKLHMLYNLTAIPAEKTRQTLGLEIEPSEFEWSISAIPEHVSGFRPTSHVVIDSRSIDEWLLSDIEDILYGTDTTESSMPPLDALTTFIRKWERLIIVDNNDGTWTAIARNDADISLNETTGEFTITATNVTFPDADSYTISSSDKNDEDV